MLTQLLAFVAVAAVVICTPGPDTALMIRNAVAAGRRGGVVTAAGVAAGQATWTLAASLGIAAVLVASQPAFVALRLVGAAYLAYLGIQSLRAAFARRRPHPELDAAAARITARQAFRQGLVSNLSNPKMVAFFTSLLPQFAGDGRGSFVVLLSFGFLFCLLTLAWLTAYSFAVDRARRFLVRGRVRRAMDAIAGAVLLAFGVRLGLDAR